MATHTTANGPPLPADWEGYWTDYTLLKGRSLSPRTLAAYRDSFIYLGRFLAPEVPDLADLTRRQVAAYLDFTLASTSATTTGLRYRGLAAVINFLADPGEDDEPFIPKNPMKGLRPPKVEEQPVAVLTVDDGKALLKACKGPAFEARRDEALIRFLFDTGVRRGELVSMRTSPDHLNLHEGRALVSGKTGARWVAFGPATGAALYRYIRVRRSRADGSDALWIGHKGPLAGNGIYQVLARRFKDAGVEVGHRTHVFRHTFSHMWQSSGGGVAELVALNGWKGPAMAYRYGKSAAAERAHEAHRKLSPGELLDAKVRKRR